MCQLSHAWTDYMLDQPNPSVEWVIFPSQSLIAVIFDIILLYLHLNRTELNSLRKGKSQGL